MKLSIVTTSFRPYQWYSGISNAVFLLVKCLNEKYDTKINIFSPQSQGLPQEENHENFSIKRFSTVNLSKLHGYFVSRQAFGLVEKEDADIIHSFHYGYFPATVGFLEAKKKQIPHIFTTAYHPPGSLLKRKLFQLYNISQGRRIIKNSDAVLPFNKNEKNQLSKISHGKFNIVPCPINHKIYKPLNKKNSKLTLAFVGPMEIWKGPLVAFDIFKKIEKERKDVNFIFVGNGTLDHQISMYRNLKSMGGKRFTFMRNLTTSQLADVYNKADLLVSPTSYESFGCTIAESMMCGTPVVSTKVGAVPETVGNGGMLVNYGNWDDMKDKITVLLDDSHMRKRLTKNAVKHSNQYKDDAVARKIHNIYKNVLK